MNVAVITTRAKGAQSSSVVGVVLGSPGSVAGPASAVDGHLAVFSGTSGQIIKDGGAVPTTLPASDVYAWAKAATKPSYSNTEVGAAAASHSHTLATGASDVTATATELNYCSGLTSNIQTQLGDVAAALTAIVG